MRYRPEHKETTHRKIVESASKEFREHGFEGVGIAKLMGLLDLTHGGFYAHFAGKDALVSESLVEALDQVQAVMLAALNEGGLPGLLRFYLGEEHRDHPATGCPLSSLTAEISRLSPAARDAFTRKVLRVAGAVAEHLPGPPSPQKLARVSFLFASMAGAMSFARAVSDPALSKSVLDATREQLLILFCAEPA